MSPLLSMFNGEKEGKHKSWRLLNKMKNEQTDPQLLDKLRSSTLHKDSYWEGFIVFTVFKRQSFVWQHKSPMQISEAQASCILKGKLTMCIAEQQTISLVPHWRRIHMQGNAQKAEGKTSIHTIQSETLMFKPIPTQIKTSALFHFLST